MALSVFDETEFRHLAKLTLCLLGVAIALGYHLHATGNLKPVGRRIFNIALLLAALLSVGAYFEFGWKRFGVYMNPHDVYHYYVGAKYSEEHEYYNLYRAALVADSEMGARYRERNIRNLDNSRFESVNSVLARKEEIKSKFTPERWESFKADVKYFRDLVPYWKWKHMLSDKGYNAPPVWNAAARYIAESAPTDNPLAMSLITYIDLVLLLVMFGFVWLAFGWQAMLMVVLFHNLNYFMSFVHIKGAFMRLDWYVAIVIAVCLLRLRWSVTAGVFMAWAAMSRVFPLIFCFGLGVQLLGELWQYWRARRSATECRPLTQIVGLRFFVGLALASFALFVASVYADGDTHLWSNFLSKISMHNNDISTTRMGFKYLFLWDSPDKALAFATQQFAWKSCLCVATLLTALLVLRMRAEEALALGFIPFYFLTAPTFYYYVILTVPFLFFLINPKSAFRCLGAALFFLGSAACFAIGFNMDHGFDFFGWMSLGMLFMVLYMAFCAVASHWQKSSNSEQESRLQGVALNHRRSAEAVKFAMGMFLAFTFGGASTLAYAAATHTPVEALIRAATVASQQSLAENRPGDGEDSVPSSPVDRKKTDSSVKSPVADKTRSEDIAPSQSAESDTRPTAFPSSAKEGEVELVFVGDIMTNRGVARSLAQNGRNYDFPFAIAAPLLQLADIAFGNLECPVSGRGEKLPSKRYVFNAKPETAPALAKAGFDLVSLANNHTLDYGPVALEDTVRLVEEAGVKTSGVATNDDPQIPVVFEREGLKVGYLSYADPVPTYSYAKEFFPFERRPAKGTREILARDIAALRSSVDVLVVSMHWGVEYKPPTRQQVELGHYIIDQGADIVAGHHPHVQQDAERYKDGLIIYSMGNFVFDQRSRPATREVRLYRVYVNKNGFTRAEYLPMTLDLDVWQPRPVAKTFVEVTATQPPKTLEETESESNSEKSQEVGG